MSEHESIAEAAAEAAAEIVLWQASAQQLPLPDIRDMVSDCQNHLAGLLNAFNKIYSDHTEHKASDDALAGAVMDVARQATATAIFTLGVTQRAAQVSAAN
jgi:hypothetical protein